jgi:hypothetical protein
MSGNDITMQNVSFNNVLSWGLCHSVFFCAMAPGSVLSRRGPSITGQKYCVLQRDKKKIT